ncbi:TYR [Branchiostoma lanceolatum]|uniref:Tyrosinase n=1 Tax=Branchiostoma lanceolatum TaxID=7740 RepID=A0A8J9ZE55_BRALA|nr:TYR [Branchiostoma lanceolatum]
MKALGLLLVLAGCFRRGDAQFPRVCTSDDALDSKECCPIPPGFNAPCGGPGRGHCADTPDPTVKDHALRKAYNVDDRRHWPTVFFNRTCKCEGNFSGYDCTKCIWGHRGPNCETKKPPAVRRNIKQISAEEKMKFQRYFDQAKNTTSDFVFALEFKENIRGSENFVNISVFDYFVAAHYYASRETTPPRSTGICGEEKDCFLDFAHEGVGFPTWHRAYILEAERAIQEANSDPDWTMPYWDWSAAENHQCDICTNEYVGANDENGNLDSGSVFASWRTICENLAPFFNATQTNHTKPCDVTNPTGRLKRNPGKQDPVILGASLVHLPFATEVDFALRFPVFDTPPYNRTANCSFRNLLEGFAATDTGKYRGTIYDNGTRVPGAHTLHNQVHIYLNGTMSAVASAANDPTFFLHHCNVDRLLETWIRRHGTPNSANPEKGAPPGQNRNEYIVPFFPPYSHAEMFKRSTELGYDYQKIHGQGESDAESDMGECSAAPLGGVSPGVIGMGVGIGLGFVLVLVAIVLLFFWCRRRRLNEPQQQAADAGTEMSVQT